MIAIKKEAVKTIARNTQMQMIIISIKDT
jgi:hypothetical protein